MRVEEKLVELGVELPQASDQQGSYCNCVRTGNLLYVSGKDPWQVFGEKGVHARSVFGAASLRGNLPVIIDSIFEVNK